MYYIYKSIKFVYNQSLKNHRYYYIRSINRISPHNEDILSIIIGFLLGNAYANKRTGEEVRICYRQSIRYKEYLFWLNNFFYNRGYTSNLKPKSYSRMIQSPLEVLIEYIRCFIKMEKSNTLKYM